MDKPIHIMISGEDLPRWASILAVKAIGEGLPAPFVRKAREELEATIQQYWSIRYIPVYIEISSDDGKLVVTHAFKEEVNKERILDAWKKLYWDLEENRWVGEEEHRYIYLRKSGEDGNQSQQLD